MFSVLSLVILLQLRTILLLVMTLAFFFFDGEKKSICSWLSVNFTNAVHRMNSVRFPIQLRGGVTVILHRTFFKIHSQEVEKAARAQVVEDIFRPNSRSSFQCFSVGMLFFLCSTRIPQRKRIHVLVGIRILSVYPYFQHIPSQQITLRIPARASPLAFRRCSALYPQQT